MAARYASGDTVAVLAESRPGHIRTPEYVRGKRGWIERDLGAFPNPESLAYGGSGEPEQPLYRVGFRQRDLWNSYRGSEEDVLFMDIYEHWLRTPDGGESR
ncbi:MAG: nitrile hydratase subunit beta [Rubrobacter sp.]|nr:nitrile hydratase subunit beta [Rubrobacter sp.]